MYLTFSPGSVIPVVGSMNDISENKILLSLAKRTSSLNMKRIELANVGPGRASPNGVVIFARSWDGCVKVAKCLTFNEGSNYERRAMLTDPSTA